MILFDQEEKNQNAAARIKVVGVGGAGGNTVNCMIESGFQAAEFYAINTDAQALKLSLASVKIQIGLKSTKGLGAGANPEVGKRAAEEDLDKVMQELGDADIVFVTGGMGGGTGSGAIPVIVKALREKGVLTIAVVTKPFAFEGKRRARITQEALNVIRTTVDTLLIIPNQKLLEVTDHTVSMIDGFGMINEVLNQSVRSISEIITRAGHINVDFADVREVMKDKGLAVMGTARASGQGRAKKAALEAITSPLLENMSIAGARAVLLNITGGADLGLHEISEAASVIYEQVDEDANIILGSVIDSQMTNEVSVTIIATGFPEAVLEAAALEHARSQEKQVIEKNEEKSMYVPIRTIYPQPKPFSFVEAMPKVSQQEVVQEQSITKKEPEVLKMHDYVLEKGSVCDFNQEREELSLVQEMKPAEKVVQKVEQVAAASESVYEKKEGVAQEPTVAQASAAMIDINDLDIPAFMRKQVREKRTAE